MPALTQASTICEYQGSKPQPPHELFTTSGARSGRGLFPARSVGATIHWPAASSDAVEQPLDSQPFVAIHFAPGATPYVLALHGLGGTLRHALSVHASTALVLVVAGLVLAMV